MRVELREKKDALGVIKPRGLLFIAESEAESCLLDALGNCALRAVPVSGEMRISDGYGLVYVELKIPDTEEEDQVVWPTCAGCGASMIQSKGGCFVCPNCGESSGRS